MGVAIAIGAVDVLAREAALFAGIGFLVGGIDDLLVDLIYLGSSPRRIAPAGPAIPLRYAVLVPAWDESAVIAKMLTATLERFGDRDVRVYVGLYPNDSASIAAVAKTAERDARIRVAISAVPGPTTKGDNLNSIWRELVRDEATDRWRADAIILHDAEDLVHSEELIVFDRHLAEYDYVQLPVLPLIANNSRWVSGHYADEFAEAHRRNLIVRQRIGASLPLAGTGCAIRRSALDPVATTRAAGPFDADSLTEDYELGLALTGSGARGCFAQTVGCDGGPVAVRAFFPADMNAAVRQKARWMNGIALLGWDRIGWIGSRGPAELWMRMRDRRAPLAMLVLAAAYLALGAFGLTVTARLFYAAPMPDQPDWIATLFIANSTLLLWRLAMRAGATGRIYGWREGLRAMPRMMTANLIGLFAARRALIHYVALLRGGRLTWDKTAHVFPAWPGTGR